MHDVSEKAHQGEFDTFSSSSTVPAIAMRREWKRMVIWANNKGSVARRTSWLTVDPESFWVLSKTRSNLGYETQNCLAAYQWLGSGSCFAHARACLLWGCDMSPPARHRVCKFGAHGRCHTRKTLFPIGLFHNLPLPRHASSITPPRVTLHHGNIPSIALIAIVTVLTVMA